MRKTILIFAACVVSMLASAQILEVVSVQELKGASYQDARVAGISPNGDYVLMTNGSNQGLKRYDIASGSMRKLTDAEGAGFNVQISRDGNQIVFRERFTGTDKLRYNNIMRADFSANTKQMVAAKQVNHDMLVAPDAKIILTNSECKMFITKNGKKIHVAPQGNDVNYIWASLSPDQTKILYYVSELGCYVCNIDGSNSKLISIDGRAPQWYDNNTIIAMNDQDDGHYTTQSAILAFTLDGKVQVLTTPDMIAMYPFAAEGKVVFSTLEGKTYLLNVK
jgi:Tol biopolymer transport system component